MAQAIRAVADGLRQAVRGVRLHSRTGVEFDDFAGGGLRILLENTAGMGMCVGSRFAELREIMDEAPELPLGVCFDTAHAFQAGHPIHTAAGLDDTIEALDRSVRLRRVAVIHANDSKTAFGSRLDRHEHIGKGQIGRDAFRRILAHPRLSASTPGGLPGRGFILETPIDAPGDDRRNVRVLWALAGVKAKPARGAADGLSKRSKTRVRGRDESRRSRTKK
jgi:deoxyribonuclease-4